MTGSGGTPATDGGGCGGGRHRSVHVPGRLARHPPGGGNAGVPLPVRGGCSVGRLVRGCGECHCGASQCPTVTCRTHDTGRHTGSQVSRWILQAEVSKTFCFCRVGCELFKASSEVLWSVIVGSDITQSLRFRTKRRRRNACTMGQGMTNYWHMCWYVWLCTSCVICSVHCQKAWWNMVFI